MHGLPAELDDRAPAVPWDGSGSVVEHLARFFARPDACVTREGRGTIRLDAPGIAVQRDAVKAARRTRLRTIFVRSWQRAKVLESVEAYLATTSVPGWRDLTGLREAWAFVRYAGAGPTPLPSEDREWLRFDLWCARLFYSSPAAVAARGATLQRPVDPSHVAITVARLRRSARVRLGAFRANVLGVPPGTAGRDRRVHWVLAVREARPSRLVLWPISEGTARLLRSCDGSVTGTDLIAQSVAV